MLRAALLLVLVLALGMGAPPSAGAALVYEGSLSDGLFVEGNQDLPVHGVYGMADQIGRVLLPSLPPGAAAPATHLTVHLERQDPALAPQLGTIECLTRKKESYVRVSVYIGYPSPPESWLRQIVAGVLYRRAAMLGARYPEGTTPVALPYWIVEGAWQAVDGRNEETFKAVFRRARDRGTAPTLETVIGWDGPGEGPVFGTWRAAYSSALYRFYQTAPGHRGDLDRWLASLPKGDAPIPAGKAAEQEWADFQKGLTERNEDALAATDLYSWDRSRNELEALKSVAFPAWTAPAGNDPKPEAKVRPATPSSASSSSLSSKGARAGEAAPPSAPALSSSADTSHPWEAVTLPLADLPKETGHPLFAGIVQDRIEKLIVLEMRANFAWRPVIGLYRDSLSTLLNPDPVAASAYPVRLAYAQTAQERLGSLVGRVTDYLNWFEVNRRSGSEASQGLFGGYFDLMGRFEAGAPPR